MIARSRSAFLNQVSSPVPVQAVRRAYDGDAFWLWPEQRVVEFIDRPELVRLREWCMRPDEPQVMLVTGAGGVGKTRLALRLAEELGELGWLCRRIRCPRSRPFRGLAAPVGLGWLRS